MYYLCGDKPSLMVFGYYIIFTHCTSYYIFGCLVCHFVSPTLIHFACESGI